MIWSSRINLNKDYIREKEKGQQIVWLRTKQGIVLFKTTNTDSGFLCCLSFQSRTFLLCSMSWIPCPPHLLVAPQKLNAAKGAKNAIMKIVKGQVFPGGRHNPTPASTAWEVEHGLNLRLSPLHQAPLHQMHQLHCHLHVNHVCTITVRLFESTRPTSGSMAHLMQDIPSAKLNHICIIHGFGNQE